MKSHQRGRWRQVGKIPKQKKYENFCKIFKIKYNYKKRPYSSLIDVFKFRDSIAHGKTTTDRKTSFNINIDPENIAQAEWQEIARDISKIKQTVEDVKLIINELGQKSGTSNDPLNEFGSSTIVANLKHK
ncbi:MAG: hypothetical protein KDD94_15155 [Calditrichaeota bacterium]|nr:hypothetical protein [Calditrichota bacterium]